MQGYIKLHRAIIKSDIYQMPPLYLRVFERLLLEANHKDTYIPYRYPGTKTVGKKLIKRGERLTSIRDIAEWVGWYERGKFKVPNPKTISSILNWLVENNMLEIYDLGNRKETHYSIVNYSVYQDCNDDKSNSQVTEKKQSTDTNNNDNNDNNDNNIYDDDIYREVNIKLQQAYFNTFKVLPSITQLDILTFFLKKSDQIPEPLDIDTVIYALERTAVWNGSNVAYTEKILWTWYEKGVRTKEQAEMLVKEREIQIAEKRKQQQQHQPKKQYKSKYERDMDSLKRAYDKAIQDEKGGNEFDIF